MRLLLLCSLILSQLFLVSCQDSDRLDRLEADIRAVKSDTKREVQEIKSLVALDDGAGGGSSLGSRVAGLETRMTEVLKRYDTEQSKMAYLRQNADGHATMATDHGNFLIRLEKVEFNVGGNGFTARLNIGNLGALMVDQFILKGDFGAGVPTLAPGQEYSAHNQEIEAWQKTLKPFQYRITRPLRPMSWTPVDVILEASSRDDLELIRFSMQIESAHLDATQSGGSVANTSNSREEQDFAYIPVGGESASLLKTDYGAFLIVIKKATPSGDGTKLELDIGNPYNFIVNECRIRGHFGDPIPKVTAGEDPEKFRGRLTEWMGNLQPFESNVSGKLSGGKWSSVSILVPGSLSQVQFLRANLKVDYVTLPQK